ncbi:hypothetical protein R6Q59_027500 [Mikania micrantha]
MARGTVVIKRYPFEHYLYQEKAFFTEIEKLTGVKHPNIVTLHGFCVEDSEMILVLENLSNGCLGDHFDDIEKRRILTWEKRLKICIDVAHALNYLHSEMEDQKIIINRDIHLNNIGLDDNWRAKIVDFWFSVFISPSQEEEVPYEKSIVYTDPEYGKTGKLKKESDVYSFGVVLFEVLCGRRPSGNVHKAMPLLAKASKIELAKQMIDPLLNQEQAGENNFAQNKGPNKDSWHTFFEITCRCLLETQDQRPTMKVVVEELEKALFFHRRRLESLVQPCVKKRVGCSSVTNPCISSSDPVIKTVDDEVESRFGVTTVCGRRRDMEDAGMNLEHLKIRLTDIRTATNNFSEIHRIASESFYTCYRATLHLDKENPSSVVIQRITSGQKVYAKEEFVTEMKILTRVKHPNIVTLLGFCVEDSEMILVFENFSNGYLKDYLEKNKKLPILTWEKRLKICIDVAQALNHLHYGMEDQKMMIINYDICSLNIGLDENWGAKIASFHFSALLDQKDEASRIVSKARMSYMDPESTKTCKLKREVDVYSFGVVLLEILCGRPAYDPMYCTEDCKGLVRMARRTLEEIIDPIIEEETGEKNRGTYRDSLQTVFEIANQCVTKTQDQRPTMKDVVKKLKKALFFHEYNKDYRKISLVNIKHATQNFHDKNCIGRGGFGKVYKGSLQDDDGFKTIVAKRLDTRFGQGEQQFLCELQILLEYKHENVIGLIGYCDEEDEKIIVYEYASRGSLDRYLNDASLTWVERLDICIDVASALNFLHGGVGKQAKVIHRDIKTANILLSHGCKAKLADFGLSLISPITQKTDYVIDHICGTLGYMDPLYKKLGYLTIESDIYSFGVVLFELLCGKSTYSFHKLGGEFLSDFIKNKFKQGINDEVVFEQIKEPINPKSLATFQKIGYQCLHHERDKRPTAEQVLTQLKKAMKYQNMASTITKFAHLKIPLEDIVKATNNFHYDNIIGNDGFGTMYKGRFLRSGKESKIVARRLDPKHVEGDIELLTEISMVSDLNHTNIVSIIGFCDEKDEKIIVTTYEANGSLEQYLKSPALTWTQRLRICVGVARALSYLHCEKGRGYGVIHGNINSSTILLDENWEPKLSGFEHSVTMGCVDPAIEKMGGATHESDVYSFGVVLFEMLCGRKAYEAIYHYENKTLHDIIHPDLEIYPQSFFKYSTVAYSCLNEDRACRPSMKYIVGELEKTLELHLPVVNIFAHLQIPLEDIAKATNNFHDDNIIGHGGFGTAYKGRLLRSGNEFKIAARRRDRKHREGDVEFLTEISMLCDLNHKNVVSLVGFCDEKDEKIIVTTYVANGSLGQYLTSPDLTWTQRLRISVGVARALSYLHYDQGRDYGVIHRNINSDTILLDENWEPKLSGFEISIKQSVNRMGRVILCVPIGTIGYMDPEIDKIGGVTHKSDIYSFGVVLFEILYGRKAYVNVKKMEARDRRRPTIKTVVKYSHLAISCLEEEGAHRPDIYYIVAELEKALELQLPREILGKNLEHLKIPLDHIKLVTDDFSDTYKLGDTAYYSFYSARIHHFDKDQNLSFAKGKNVIDEPPSIVIKRIRPDRLDEQGHEMFLAELEMLTCVKHPSIVTLLGFCVEASEKILVLEHLFQGRLSSYLTKKVNEVGPLTWEKRLKICIDVAQALNYLHYEMEDQKIIINRNINSHNIWLDDNYGAKIVEFGISIFMPPNQIGEALYLKRKLGLKVYMDPKYALRGKLKRESDVYSFGVVLFEVVCGKLADNPIFLEESQDGLADVARRCFCTGTIEDIIDPMIKEEIGSENSFILNAQPNKDSLDTFLKIAYQCIAKIQDHRPTMEVVVMELQKALSFLEGRVSHIYQLVNEAEKALGGQLIPNVDQLVNELEKTLELHFTHENIPEERVQHPNTEEQPDTVEVLDEHQLMKLKQMKICLTDIKKATDSFSETYAILYAPCHTLYRAEVACIVFAGKRVTEQTLIKITSDSSQTADHFDESMKGKNKEEQCPKRTVVIKRFLHRDDEQREPMYYTSLAVLSNVEHRNINTILGFCVEGSEMILVTENVSKGYLCDYLGNNVNDIRVLTWEKRLKICIDVANALNYLHSEMEDQKMIINRHINSHNIGLDENWGAKIVEFELSVFVPRNHEPLYPDRIVGNTYYIDPEYDATGRLKKESDVYSFGVVLFEILCGRIAYDRIYLQESDRGLAPVARRSFRAETLEEMIDPVIKGETGENSFLLNRGPNLDSLHTFIEIAYQCVAETQDQRPTMNVVVQELEKALWFQKNSKDSLRISLEEIKMATNNFHGNNCIGRGGFGRVYKGKLQDGDGFKTIVAKRLDASHGQGEQQFLNELQILLEYKHENVIGLVGYCDEKDEKIIVYEYASRGSLDRYLNNASLTWMKRLDICIDVARALDFLHGGIGKQAKVIIRDIKAANILLNDDNKAKLADFGLSLISPINQETDYVIDHVCGTFGYVDPIYKKSGFLTIESDIYSFGVVLFEVLCGRSTFAIHKHEGHYLPDYIKNIFENGKHDEMVFEHIRGQIMPQSLTTFQEIAYQCLEPEREKRPTTKKILMQLVTALSFQVNTNK